MLAHRSAIYKQPSEPSPKSGSQKGFDFKGLQNQDFGTLSLESVLPIFYLSKEDIVTEIR